MWCNVFFLWKLFFLNANKAFFTATLVWIIFEAFRRCENFHFELCVNWSLKNEVMKFHVSKQLRSLKDCFWCRKEFIAVRKHRLDELDCLAVYPAEEECLEVWVKKYVRKSIKKGLRVIFPKKNHTNYFRPSSKTSPSPLPKPRLKNPSKLTWWISESFFMCIMSHVRLACFFGGDALESHFWVVANHNTSLTQNKNCTRNDQKNCWKEKSEHELLIGCLQIESNDGCVDFEFWVETRETCTSVVIRTVFSEKDFRHDGKLADW